MYTSQAPRRTLLGFIAIVLITVLFSLLTNQVLIVGADSAIPITTASQKEEGFVSSELTSALSLGRAFANGCGTPQFRATPHYAVGLNPYASAAGDFNQDGKPDLVVANRESDTVSVLPGDRIKSGGNSFEAVGKEKAYP